MSRKFESRNLYKNPFYQKMGGTLVEECIVNNRSLSSVFLIVIITSGLVLVSTVQFGTVKASTVVSGLISSDTTWTLAGSPYMITGDVLVDAGAVLNIEAGVAVKFGDGTRLIVDGTLIADGDEAQPITFTSDAATPSPGNWGTINFRGSSTESIMKWTKIGYASDGVTVNAGSPTLEHCDVSNNQRYGVYVSAGAPTIVESTVSGNGKDGIWNYVGTITITSSTISNNKGNGIYKDSETVTVQDSVISSNLQSGIYGGAGGQFTVSNCTVSYNGYDGVTICYSDLIITDSEITYNNRDGVRMESGTLSGTAKITKNMISHNTGNGVYKSSGSMQLSYNDITFNNVGIAATPFKLVFSDSFQEKSGDTTIDHNNIIDNTLYAVENIGPGTNIFGAVLNLTATNNWWGTTNTSLIDQLIRDVKDDFSLGRVEYVPFLTEPAPTPNPSPAPTPSPANQTISRIQSYQYGAGLGAVNEPSVQTSITLANAPIWGDVLISVIGIQGIHTTVTDAQGEVTAPLSFETATVSSITETGVKWSRQVRSNSTAFNLNVEIWLGVVVSQASPSITVNLDSLPSNIITALTVDICEYRGIALESSLDKTATSNGFGSISDTGLTALTTQPKELWIGAILFESSGQQTSPTNGFLLLDGQPNDTGGRICTAFLEKTVNGQGTANTGTTIKYGDETLFCSWVGCIATFLSGPVDMPTGYSDSWPMFHNDLSHSGYSESTGPLTNQILWKYKAGKGIESSPSVVDGVVYFGSLFNGRNGFVNALNAATGSKIWQFATDSGVESSPAVIDGVVYIGSYSGNVYALNASSGSEIWSFNTGGSVFPSPAVADGKVYVGSATGYMYALNATNGSPFWSYYTGGRIFSSPAVVEGVVYFGSDDQTFYALRASDGAQIWNYSTVGYIDTSPAVADGIVYFGSRDGYVYALNATNGLQIWSFRPLHGNYGSYYYSTPAVANGVVYVGGYDSYIYALSATNGSIFWEFRTGGYIFSSPVVAGKVVYVGSYDGNVYALDAAKGGKIWSYQTGGKMRASCAVANGVAYVGSDDGYLYAFGSPNNQPAVSYEISGYILDENGKGIEGAHVIFNVPDIVPSVTSGASGYYSISAPAGTYHVNVWSPFDSNYINYDEPSFVVGSDMTKNITLQSGYKVSGYISDSLGNPVVGAVVLLDNYGSGWFSNSAGYYFLNVPAGTYTINAHPRTVDYYSGPTTNFPIYYEYNFTVNSDTVKNITVGNLLSTSLPNSESIASSETSLDPSPEPIASPEPTSPPATVPPDQPTTSTNASNITLIGIILGVVIVATPIASFIAGFLLLHFKKRR